MSDNDSLSRSAASFRRGASSDFDKAVAALIALAYRYRRMGADFLWDGDPGLYAEAMRICRDLSDSLAERAMSIARAIIDGYYFDESWDSGDGEGYVPVVTRFDMQGSHLLELLAIWIALAFDNGVSDGELRVSVSRYLANPFASPLWRGLPVDILKWGRGYSRNILDQIAVIGQNAIISAYRHAEMQQARANGAVYYIRRRGSNYDCPDCDDMCGYPIPIDTPFEWLHSRCMCWPEFHYEQIPL